MLDALDTTLESLLKRELPPNVPSGDTEVFISFDTPFQGSIKKSQPLIFFFMMYRRIWSYAAVIGQWNDNLMGRQLKNVPLLE